MFEEKDLGVNGLLGTTATGLSGTVLGGNGLLGAIPPDQRLMNSMIATNTTGAPWRLHNTFEKEATYALGTPYSESSGKPIPDDWRGAQLTGWDRSILFHSNHPRWVYRMRSDWGNDIVLLHLDANEVSGGEADKIAGTYMEALNQRRIG